MKTTSLILTVLALISQKAIANSVYQTIYHQNNEVCEIPLNASGGPFSGKQSEKLKELCDMDFYSNETANCFKDKSTNPGVEIFEVPENSSKSYMEKGSVNCKGQKKLAKFKQSITCSYTPSILGYYHFSQFFDGFALVPTSVYRTMDRGEHKLIVDKAISNNSRIKKYWLRFEQAHDEYVTRKKLFLDADVDYNLYGALSENPRGEGRYFEIWGYVNGKLPAWGKRYQGFRQSSKSGFRYMKSSQALIDQSISKRFKYAAQWIQRIKDISGMIVMDYIMSQQDRFVNQHYYTYHVIMTVDGSTKKYKAKKYDVDYANKVLIKKKDGKKKPFIEVAENVKYMLLKDNDCGVTKGNKMKKVGLLDDVSHLSPKFYKKLLEWNEFIHSPNGKNHMQSVAKLTNADINKIRGLTTEAVDKLQMKCLNGQLQLDVSLKHFVRGENPHDRSLCTL
jgi:hypothetical protein